MDEYSIARTKCSESSRLRDASELLYAGLSNTRSMVVVGAVFCGVPNYQGPYGKKNPR